MTENPTNSPDDPATPCGCTPERMCPQHWQALDRTQRAAQRRRRPDTA